MQIKEKIRKVYEKHGVIVDEKTLKTILKDKERTKGIMRLYKEEELESMNYILGKPEDNKYFTQQELEMMNKIDLFNKKTVEVCKKIWDNRDDKVAVNEIIKNLNKRRCLILEEI